MIPAEDDLTVIDTLQLAFEALLICRFGSKQAGLALNLVVDGFAMIDQTGCLEVEVPTSSLVSAPLLLLPRTKVDPLAARHQVRDLPSQQQRLLALLRASIEELQRLCLSNSPTIVLVSIGYALHELPRLVRRGGFRPLFFRQLGFRAAAYVWSDLSVEMHLILCELAETSIDRVEKLIKIDGFTVDMIPVVIPFSAMSVDDFSVDDLDWS
jgi:hypothetical protein